ncbi:MAG: AlpA family phage regulatory protein [Burkholderiales bacterium]|nr:AlpA family phage regulatory protein [Burkholderiales bacterium]MBK8665455.1 AlpA family phage regulatory protein [Burkholderiales bacterium]
MHMSRGIAMSQALHPADRPVTALTLPTPAFFRMVDVVRITALSRATVYRRIAEGRFPPPVHLGGRACGWTPSDLQRWIDDPQSYRSVTAGPRTAVDSRSRGSCSNACS